MASTSNLIYAIYAIAYQRAPDKFGYDYWAGKVQSNELSLSGGPSSLSNSILAQASISTRTTDSVTFVNSWYAAVGRTIVDTAGAAYWLGRINTLVGVYGEVAGHRQAFMEFLGAILDWSDTGGLTTDVLSDAQACHDRLVYKVTLAERFTSSALALDSTKTGTTWSNGTYTYTVANDVSHNLITGVVSSGSYTTQYYVLENLKGNYVYTPSAGQLSQGSNADLVLAMYVACLKRAPDANGYLFWLQNLNNGNLTRDSMEATSFGKQFLSNSFWTGGLNTDGNNPDNAVFVNAVYTQILGWAGDTAGKQYWLNILNSRVGLFGSLTAKRNLIVSMVEAAMGTLTQGGMSNAEYTAAQAAKAALLNKVAFARNWVLAPFANLESYTGTTGSTYTSGNDQSRAILAGITETAGTLTTALNSLSALISAYTPTTIPTGTIPANPVVLPTTTGKRIAPNVTFAQMQDPTSVINTGEYWDNLNDPHQLAVHVVCTEAYLNTLNAPAVFVRRTWKAKIWERLHLPDPDTNQGILTGGATPTGRKNYQYVLVRK